MKTIKVLGTGCPKCTQLAENAEQAAQKLGLEFTLTKVTDLNDIMQFGVMLTPALVVDDQVCFTGKVPNVADLKGILSK